jgi:hypothetical protein
MKLKITPLALILLATLCGLNAWLLAQVFAEFAPVIATAPQTRNEAAKYPTANPAPVVQKPISAYSRILAQPVFFRTRAPYLPPPPPAPVTQNIQAPAPVVNPGLSVAGVIINEKLRKAYLLKQNEPAGTWVAEGENVLGWTLQSVKPTGITLTQSNRTIDLELYLKR